MADAALLLHFLALQHISSSVQTLKNIDKAKSRRRKESLLQTCHHQHATLLCAKESMPFSSVFSVLRAMLRASRCYVAPGSGVGPNAPPATAAKNFAGSTIYRARIDRPSPLNRSEGFSCRLSAGRETKGDRGVGGETNGELSL